MKLCPLCRAEMSDAQGKCPSCNVDYFDAVVQDISSGKQPEIDKSQGHSYKPSPKQALDGLDANMKVLDGVKSPTLSDSLRNVAWIPSMMWSTFSLLSAFLAKAHIFYVMAGVLFLITLYLLYRRFFGEIPLSSGMTIIRTVQRMVTSDGAEITEEFAGDKEVGERLAAMQKRIDDATHKQEMAERAGVRKFAIWMAISMVVVGVGVALLAVHNRANNAEEIAYQQQPEWTKARDSYLADADQGDQSPQEPRVAVLRLMIEAQEVQAAEEFFFVHCQGKVGDVDCALCVINHYDNGADATSLNGFIDRLRLRYDSDTRKLKSRKSRKK